MLGLVALGVGGGDKTVDSLPISDQAAPGELSGRTGGTTAKPRFFLGFESAAGNLGDGPLIVLGSRPNMRVRTMQVTQEIQRTDGSARSLGVATRLRYVRSPDHSHWRLLGFMRYELRRADGSLVGPDRKTGFCLGNRYEIRPHLEREPGPRFGCGKNKPDALGVRGGISVGYGDDYDAHLEGQEFEITRAAGRAVSPRPPREQQPTADREGLRQQRRVDGARTAAGRARNEACRRASKSSSRCPSTATCP